MGPLAALIVELAKVLIWPIALFLLFYLKGEALLSLFQQHTIRVKRRGFTLEILPPIRDIPEERELLEQRNPRGAKPRSKDPEARSSPAGKTRR
jgi:hypothetical protein